MEGVAGQGPARVAGADGRRPFAPPEVSDRGHGESIAPAPSGEVSCPRRAAGCPPRLLRESRRRSRTGDEEAES